MGDSYRLRNGHPPGARIRAPVNVYSPSFPGFRMPEGSRAFLIRRAREGDVNVVEDGLFQRDVGASHPRGNLVVHVDNVVAGPPIIPRLAARQGLRMGRLQAPACGPPRGGHNLLGPGESQVERGRARVAAPGEGRGLERLLEIHDAGCQSVVIEPAECRESGREVLQAERVNLLRSRDGEDAKGGAGHDAERPFRTDEETLQIQARRGSGDGPGSDHAPIREDGFESQDLVSHRPAKITGIADAVRPDRSANGGPGPGPGIVSQAEPSLPEPTVQSSNTIPASTVAVPEAASIERTRRMFRRSR